MVAACCGRSFNARSGEQERELVTEALERPRQPLPKVAQLLEEAETDLLGFSPLPSEHWSKVRATNPLKRVNPR